jgi:thiamine monophosphate synthase
MFSEYEKKYHDLLQRIQGAQANGITLFVVREPQELGDTYEDIVESLNRLADADLNLAVLPRAMRGAKKNKLDAAH